MFRLDVTDYETPAIGEEGRPVSKTYDVRDSMVTILLAPFAKLNGTALLRSHLIGEKILKSDGSVLLEDAEYHTLKQATDAFVGFDRRDVELVQRIMNAEKVEVTVKEATDDNA